MLSKNPVLRVGICEDDPAQAQVIQGLTERCFSDISHKITCLSNPKAFLTMKESLDIAILDIQLGELDGISVAKEINTCNPSCQIIFVTGYLEYAPEVYEVSHLSLVLKTQLMEKLPHFLQIAQKKLFERQNSMLILHEPTSIITLRQDDLIYAERSTRTTNLYCRGLDEVFKSSVRLDNLLPMLEPGQFCRCHRSYIVNFSAVRVMQRDQFQMQNNSIIPISRGRAGEVMKLFSDYISRYETE